LLPHPTKSRQENDQDQDLKKEEKSLGALSDSCGFDGWHAPAPRLAGGPRGAGGGASSPAPRRYALCKALRGSPAAANAKIDPVLLIVSP